MRALSQGSARLGGERVTFSCLSKRKSPKRRTPHGAARGKKPRGFANVGRVAPTVHPCTDGAMGAIHRAHPAGLFVRRPPALKGTPQEQERSRAKPSQATQSIKPKPASLFARRSARACALPGFPLRPGERVEEKARRGACRDARAFVAAQDVPSTNPATRSRSRRTGCPATGTPGCLSFGYLFFGQAKKSNPLAAEASGTLAKASCVSRKKHCPLQPSNNPRRDRAPHAKSTYCSRR